MFPLLIIGEKSAFTGLYYTMEAVEKGVAKAKKTLDTEPLFVELDTSNEEKPHPEYYCLQCIDLWIEGNIMFGKFRILDNKNGEELRKLVREYKVTICPWNMISHEDGKVADLDILKFNVRVDGKA